MHTQVHRDTEKVDGMFGTLVIQLPSDYSGGELIVKHRGEEKVFSFSGLQGSTNFHIAAFYADCQHEIKKVTAGNRLCLVYNPRVQEVHTKAEVVHLTPDLLG